MKYLAYPLALLSFAVLADHETEPEFGFYRTDGYLSKTYQSGYEEPPSWHTPTAIVYYNLPETNSQWNVELRTTFRCYVVDPHSQSPRLATTWFWFVVDPYQETEGSIGSRVVFNFSDRSEKRGLSNHDRDNRLFVLTNSSFAEDFDNVIVDAELTMDVLESLVKDGYLKVEAQDDGNDIEFIVLSRPTNHISQDVFNMASCCYYSDKHPNVETNDTTMATSSGVSFMDSWEKRTTDHEAKRMRVFAKN